ncbi:MAG TPA: hypothetical protein VN285_06155 [Candidatus Deferrimicrobium sp.]|nr:hypothetical protein [Candidatus Deferrimicrobium sp.]
MPLQSIKVRISPPTEPIVPGRGFYQLEEESLYVQIGPFSRQHRFFSYIESDTVRFDLDRQGYLIFIEIATPRRRWQVVPNLKPPSAVEMADIRWLDFRERMLSPVLITTPDKSLLQLRFGTAASPLHYYYLAESIIAQVDKDDSLAAVWITDIVDDIAGQEIGAFRKGLRQEPAAEPVLPPQ